MATLAGGSRYHSTFFREAIVQQVLHNLSCPAKVLARAFFAAAAHSSVSEVMQFGERTERTDECPAGRYVFPRTYIENHLFESGRFGTFCDRFPRAFPVFCVLDKGGGQL